jgi:demethylmenaquinone methyltransferase/2-methoxy-6-polyprenyl-1,4-benzoquinol methylase
MAPDPNRFAQRLFAGIAPQYERTGALLSFGQDERWRRFLVSKTNAVPGSWTLDVAAGTQLVSRELAARKNVRVVALDQSEPMLGAGREPNRLAGLDDRVHPVLGRAERLPFDDGEFDAVTFTYLLRYVEDPAATVAELARVVRPGGSIGMLEFHVPDASLARAGWWVHTRLVMPVLGTAVSPAWRARLPSSGRTSRGSSPRIRWRSGCGGSRAPASATSVRDRSCSVPRSCSGA